MFQHLFVAAIQVETNQIGIPKISADNQTWGGIVGGVFIFMGAWAMLFIIIGALRYVVSAGDQGAIKKAKDTVLYAVVGLAVSVLAFTIVQFVIGRLG